MIGRGPADEILHPALARVPGSPLAEAQLTDRQRIAVLLQGSALLAHLHHGGWDLPRGWEEARITSEGCLVVTGASPGRSQVLVQERLRDLLQRLFATQGEVAGRGPARKAARRLLEQWSQSLTPLPPDVAVGQILEAAPFLWDPAFARARQALVAEHRRGGGDLLWLAGPGPFRNRLLRTAASRQELEDLLADPGVRTIWDGRDGHPGPGASPPRLRSQAAEAGSRKPPSTREERLELARSLFALGRFEKALAAAAEVSGTEAAVLRIWCQLYLGRLGAARETLRRLGRDPLTSSQLVEVAEVAVRLLANTGDLDEAADWVARVLAETRGSARLRAQVVAAMAAWDRRDLPAMDRHLEASRKAQGDPEVAWRWHHARALRAFAAGEGEEGIQHLALAIRESRRRLRRHEAGALWNDLGLGRAQTGDLPGAERAFLHAVRLLGACDGPRRTTVALYNLAEVRLRRGRLLGVEEILERATVEDRLAGNVRGAVQDAALWARLELVQGRPQAALAHCQEALDLLEREGVSWHEAVLRLLAARALGWLGRPQEAAQELAQTTPEAWTELEPEERPALWAHASSREAALAAAAETPVAPLWHGALTGAPVPPEAWRVLEGLEPFRSARTVFDLELAAPGVAPPTWRRRAITTLRRVGATALAERLETRETGPWLALERFLKRPTPGAEDLADLFQDAVGSHIRLVWVGEEDRVLVDGAGGEEELSAPWRGGQLILRASQVDPVVRALFALVLREGLPGMASSQEPDSVRGFVGESAVLRETLSRIARVAPGDLPVLILGESGTGKELAAREIHRLSRRARGPFVAINCAALSETLLLSDLFGHVRGAFTGADRDRVGVFEAAVGGTVFLDEIGDLPPSAQGMLLRVLQEGEVRRLGESLPRKVDVRVVAATHRDLAQMVSEGGFRQDLYYRLRVAPVEMPPLRERGEDILLLARHILSRFHPQGAPPRLTAAARSRLLAHSWPGNIRELENVLRLAATLADGGVIEDRHLELPAREKASQTSYHQQVDALKRRLIEEALEAAGGNRAEAARRLQLSRQALSYLIRQLKIV